MTATTTINVTLPALHGAQRQIVCGGARFRVAACGRRFGKTLAACGESVIAASQGKRVWWVAPTFEVTRRGWNGVVNIAHRIPGVEIRRGLREVLFPGGGFIGFKSADTGAGLLGEGLDFLIVDEAALVPEDVWLRDLRPSLADRQGGALFIGTPRGHNWFWRTWLRGQDPEQSDWQSWRFPTSANPYIAPQEIEAARELLPARIFQQEYEAEFLADGGAVFRNLLACTTARRLDSPQPDHNYIFGVDWARSSDYTAIAVLERDTRRLVALERFNQIGWSLQRGRLAALAERWKPEAIWAETNSMGGPNVEALQQEGLPVHGFETTAASKGPLIESLALAFEQGEISVYDDPVLSGELQAYSMERLPSGRFRYSAPAGMHDDTVIALALAWYGTQYGGLGISFV
ncbi:MAG: hypothetical protein BroJett042_31410 [Bacteroidota bacterium]|nr:MAG: hypothetical protein BroJett042_31410 [Bacteroidota bacterium]